MNGGFSLGNMLGVNLANAKYYYFLNNDTLLLNDCLDILYQFSENNSKVGICSGQMFNKDDQKQLNFSYLPRLSLKFLGTGILRIFEPNRYPNKRKFYEEPLKVEVLNGSSMFVRSEIFDKIGGFDINYFLYCEEEDLGIRLKKEGYALFLVPKAEYKHFVSQSTQQNEKLNLKLMKEFYISYFYYFRKHKGFFATKMIQLYLFFRFITKIFKNKDFARLAFFILQEPKLSQGMRMGQKIGNV